MKQLCGCCEGIEQVTPVSFVNRPGLSALAYRVGSHSTFLESMLARVSLHSLDADSSADAFSETKPRPLKFLLTRESEDPAIAFLDAWATVADVLTFYQERIANEGFLRTAIERRSVLELAWLIGYQLRPGVASSTYLAYTLDKESEALIPAGTRALSIPGPGELPQPFETADDLEARADWNLLQVRLTRPQVLTEELGSEGRPIYLKGTATNLKQGDPLLVAFAHPGAKLYRVIKVEADSAADRTKVSLQDWVPTPLAVGTIDEGAVMNVTPEDRLKEIISRYRKAEDFGVNVAARMAQRVLDQLTRFEMSLAVTAEAASHDLPHARVLELLEQDVKRVLSPLHEDYRLAREANFTKLEPWIGRLILELEQVLQSFPRLGTSPGINQSSLIQVGSLLAALEIPASQHPKSRQQLGASLKEVLSSESDALPKILTTLRPSLASVFYRAWGNLSTTPEPAVQAFALRARASVYGHNAPLKPKTDPDTGRITGYEEWTLERETEQVTREAFGVDLVFDNNVGTRTITATLNDSAGVELGRATFGPFTAQSPPSSPQPIVGTNETVALTITQEGVSGNQATTHLPDIRTEIAPEVARA